MKKRKLIPYDKNLKELAKNLRNNSTKSEIYLWRILKNKQFYGYKFIRQRPIDKYIVDFYCPELMLAIELDGYSHQLVEVQEKDLIKEKRLNELNVAILRFSDFQVFNDIENVIRKIEFYIFEFEKHTPNPSQEGKER
ncbi:endonuclease domain-containing protein [Lutibacter sp.]|uniref:endonuclease domain-containing protein n=1 Tax=Lutibacter sp. TaxID=1925666 RepID=UPI0035621D12